MIDWLHKLISIVWMTERSPQDWKDSVLVTIFKKDDVKECGNYRGISLLSVPGKVYALLMLRRVSSRMEATISENQTGFRRGRGSSDHLFTLGITFATHGKVTHESIRRRCDIRPIADQLRINRLRWLGHVIRMDKSRLPRKALFSRLSGDRPQGGHYTTWRSLIISDLALLHQSDTWQISASDRKLWRNLIHQEPQSLSSTRSSSLRSSTRQQRADRSRSGRFRSMK